VAPLVDEKKVVKSVIDSSIGWAKNKDTKILYDCLSDDENFFIFHPSSASTIHGFEEFEQYADNVLMNDSFKYTHHEVKDLRINISKTGNVAWFSALLDDFGEWDGQPVGWENARWTGVLEKRDNSWKIVQMHFSLASD
jgi:hypothetical protein